MRPLLLQACKELLPSCDSNLVASTMALFTALTNPSKGLVLNGPEGFEDSSKIALQYIFAFRWVADGEDGMASLPWMLT